MKHKILLLLSICSTFAFATVDNTQAIISGDFEVSGGQASYALPIDVSAGRAGFQPELRFEYESDSPNGLMGIGWKINGLSSVYRCGKNLAIDGVWGGVNFDANDRYCLDGERLIAISGQPGKDKTEYRLEKNGYSKIVSYGQVGSGPANFKLWKKDGSVLEYGVTADSRVEAPSQSHVYKWSINKQLDITKNNGINYVYTEASGQHYIANINYVGGRVEFNYAERPDKTSGYLNGSLLRKNKRLINVKVKDSTGHQVGQYDLDYQQSSGTQRSLVTQIKYCTVSACTSPVKFNWQSISKVQLGSRSSTGLTWAQFYDGNRDGNATIYGRINNNKVKKFNGSAVSGHSFSLKGSIQNPIVEINKCSDRNPISFMSRADGVLATGCGKGSADTSGDGLSGVTNDDYIYVDLNGDGKDDLFKPAVHHPNVYHKKGSITSKAWTEIPKYRLSAGGTGFNNTPFQGRIGRWQIKFGSLYKFADLNNDGYLDLVFSNRFTYSRGSKPCRDCNTPARGHGDQVFVSLFNGKSFTSQKHIFSTKRSIADLSFSDVNNDGYPELLFDGKAYLNSFGNIRIASDKSNNSVSGTVVMSYSNSNPQFKDTNSDGWVDFISSGSIQRSTPFAQDRINKIEEYALTYDVIYKPIVDRSVHKQKLYFHYPVTNSTPRKYVVSDVVKSPKGYAPTKYNYVYEGAKSHLRGDGFLGFSKITKTERADVVTVTSTKFYNNGGESESSQSSSGGVPMRTFIGVVTKAYTANDLYQVGNPVLKTVTKNDKLISQIAYTYTIKEKQGTHAKYHQVYASNIRESQYSLDIFSAIEEKRAESVITRNEFGNTTRNINTLFANNGSGLEQQFKIDIATIFDSSLSEYFKNSLPTQISSRTTDLKSSLIRTVTDSFGYTNAGFLSMHKTQGNAYGQGSADRFLKYDYRYDEFGNKTYETVSGTDLYGRQDVTRYDSSGLFPVGFENAAKHTTSVNYNPKSGQIAQSISPNKGRVTTWRYDDFQRLQSTLLPGTNNTTSYTYGFGNCRSPHPQMTYCVNATASAGGSTSVQYDYAGREVRSMHQNFDGQWVYRDTTWDRDGRKIAMTRPVPAGKKAVAKVTFAYDELDREVLKQEPAADGGIARFKTEYIGLVTKMTDARGFVDTTKQNVLGHILRKTESLGASQTYTYYPDGKLKTTTDSKGNVTTIGYDNLGYRQSLDDPDMGKWDYQYNALGQLIEKNDANGIETQIYYDRLGRKVKELSGSLVSSWRYDETGALGLLSAHTNGDTETTYQYNAAGLTDSITLNVSNEQFITRYQYDNYERIVRELRPNGKAKDNKANTLTLEYIYNPYGYKSAVRSPKAEADEVFTSANFRSEIKQLISQALAQAEKYIEKAAEYKAKVKFFTDKATEYKDGTNVTTEVRDVHHLDNASKALLDSKYFYQQWCSKAGTCYFRPAVWTMLHGEITVPLSATINDSEQIYTIESKLKNKKAGLREYTATVKKATEAEFNAKSLTRNHDWYVIDTPNQGKSLFSYIAYADKPTQAELKLAAADLTDAERLFNATDENSDKGIATQRYQHYSQLADELLNLVAKVVEFSDLNCDNADRLAGDNLAENKRGNCQFSRQASQVDQLKTILTNSELADSLKDKSYVYYWQRSATDAFDHTLSETLGNGLVNTYSHNQNTGLLDSVATHKANDIFTKKQAGNTEPGYTLRLLQYDYDNHNNVIERKDIKLGITDLYSYDGLDRLDDNRVILDTPNLHGQNNADLQTRYDFNYDRLGNIIFKTGVGSYVYDQSNNAGPHAVTQANGKTYNYDKVGNFLYANSTTNTNQVERRLEWTSFNKPSKIMRKGNTVEFFYDANQQRYKKLNSDGNETIYFGKAYERITDADTGDVRHKQFIYADGKLIALNTQVQDSNNKLKDKQIRYLHYDALNSVDMITDGYGNIVERRSYDAWGKQRSIIWQDPNDRRNLIQELLTNRGYTGHEHIEEVGLIHMNGRVYDQELGRFLSADPFIQAPFMTNSFNRYSYVWNNPLKYTDPTGFTAGEVGQSTVTGSFHDRDNKGYSNNGGGDSNSGWKGIASWRENINGRTYTVTVAELSPVKHDYGLSETIASVDEMMEEMLSTLKVAYELARPTGEEMTVYVSVLSAGAISPPTLAVAGMFIGARTLGKVATGLYKSSRAVTKKVKLKGLVQNRNLKDLTHKDLAKTFEDTGYELSNHAIKRLKDPRTQKLGFGTPNDIAKIFNKGRTFDAGRGEIGYSYNGLEAIVDPKTQRIVTFRPAKNRGK